MDFKLATQFMEAFEELDKLDESALKTWRISYYEDEVKKSFTVQAASKEEAEQIGWSRVDADSLYVSEVINEDAKVDASKKFWAAAKYNEMDEDAFHAAFDDELKELGLMDVFTEEGAFVDRNIYGRIKAAKEANPDSWAVKALGRLWALRYKDGINKFKCELATMERATKEAEKREAEERAEKKKQDQERRIALAQEYKEFLPQALKLINQELFKQYKDAYNVADADIDVEIVRQFMDQSGPDCMKIIPANSGYIYKFNPNKDKATELAHTLEADFKASLKKIQIESNKAIDVIKVNQNRESYYCSAVLLGESGTLYYLNREAPDRGVAIKYVKDVTEPYRVIFTSVSHDDGNRSTYRDSVSYSYKSWDSSEKDKISNLIPKIGNGEGDWSHWTTTAVSAGDGKLFSTMDNIDSWAYTKYVSLATD